MIPVLFQVEQVQATNWWLEGGRLFLAILTLAATAYIGYLATKIANRQADTAAYKLRFDLYEKRYAIYYATVDVLETIVLMQRFSTFNQKYQAYNRTAHEITFLMPPETHDFLTKLGTKIAEYRGTYHNEIKKAKKVSLAELHEQASKRVAKAPDAQPTDEEKKRLELRNQIIIEYDLLASVFEQVLDFKKVT